MNTKQQIVTSGSWFVRAGIGAMFIVSLPAFAQQACVSLKTEAQKEETYTDAQGKQQKRVVPPGKVVPGDEIIWTITATNSCDQPAEKVVVNNNVPEHMTYVADSAMGPGTDIVYSLDGKAFAKASDLKVREADGTTRTARADEIKSIRWTLGVAIAPKSMAFVRYRAKVK
jgi:uncharacterized repeat protein (TIGR01451 family)